MGKCISKPLTTQTGPELDGHGPKMGPKLRETSAKYVNIRPEMIENARAGKVN